MAKNTATKRRELEAEREQERLAVLAQAEREKAAGVLYAIIAGAAVSALALWFMKWGPQMLWAAFPDRGARAAGTLLISGLLGGAAAATVGRGVKAPAPAAACALGWAGSAVWQHMEGAGTFVLLMNQPDIEAGALQELALKSLVHNSIGQPLSVAAGLAAASLAGWFFRAPAERAEEPDRSRRSPLRSLGYTAALIVVGSLVLWAMSWLPLKRLSPPRVVDLPVPVAAALMCGMVALLAFSLTSYNLAGWLRPRSGAWSFLAGPVAALFTGLVLAAGGARFITPLLSLLTNSSGFEIACWGAFGAAAGYIVRELNRDLNEER